jgi:hypothetical protein
MPDVSYYRGRPAEFWIAVMSGAARPTVASPAPRDIPGQLATHRAGYAEKDAATTQRPGSKH